MKQPLDRLRSRKKPVSKRVPIVFDTELADRAQELRAAAVDARERADKAIADLRLRSQAEDAETDADQARDEALDSAVWFVARSLSARAYEDLVSEHPATEDQLKKARKDGFGGLGWNPDTFPAALLASCVSYVDRDPDTGDETLAPLDEAYVKEMHDSDEWNAAEITTLVNAAIEVNSVRRVVDMGKGSGRTRSF